MVDQKSSDKNDFTLLDFWNLLKSNLAFIFSITIIFFVFSTIYVWFLVTPKYISYADVMVQIEQDSSSSSDTDFDFVNAFRLIDTIAELMKKEIILINTVSSLEELGYENITNDSVRNGLIINSSLTSYFINISYVDEDPALAKAVVDSIIDAVIEETNVTDAFPVLIDKIRRTSFASEANYYSPNRIVFSVLGLTVGAFLSCLTIIIKEISSNKFKSKEEIEQLFDLQILGVIPLMEYKGAKNVEKK